MCDARSNASRVPSAAPLFIYLYFNELGEYIDEPIFLQDEYIANLRHMMPIIRKFHMVAQARANCQVDLTGINDGPTLIDHDHPATRKQA